MFATLISTTLLLAVSASAIHITPPTGKTLAQCSQIPIQVGGASTLNVEVLQAADECGTAIKSWTGIAAQSTVHWTVNQPVGDQVVFLVEETGSEAEDWSGTYTVVAGDSSCLSGSSASAAGSSSGAAPASASGSAAGSTPSTVPDASGTPGSDGTPDTGSGSGDDPSGSGGDVSGAQNVNTNAAPRTQAGAGLALLAGLLVALAQL